MTNRTILRKSYNFVSIFNSFEAFFYQNFMLSAINDGISYSLLTEVLKKALIADFFTRF